MYLYTDATYIPWVLFCSIIIPTLYIYMYIYISIRRDFTSEVKSFCFFVIERKILDFMVVLNKKFETRFQHYFLFSKTNGSIINLYSSQSMIISIKCISKILKVFQKCLFFNLIYILTTYSLKLGVLLNIILKMKYCYIF